MHSHPRLQFQPPLEMPSTQNLVLKEHSTRSLRSKFLLFRNKASNKLRKTFNKGKSTLQNSQPPTKDDPSRQPRSSQPGLNISYPPVTSCDPLARPSAISQPSKPSSCQKTHVNDSTSATTSAGHAKQLGSTSPDINQVQAVVPSKAPQVDTSEKPETLSEPDCEIQSTEDLKTPGEPASSVKSTNQVKSKSSTETIKPLTPPCSNEELKQILLQLQVSFSSSVQKNAEQITALRAVVQQNTDQIGALKADVQQNTERVWALETSIEQISEQIATVKAEFQQIHITTTATIETPPESVKSDRESAQEESPEPQTAIYNPKVAISKKKATKTSHHSPRIAISNAVDIFHDQATAPRDAEEPHNLDSSPGKPQTAFTQAITIVSDKSTESLPFDEEQKNEDTRPANGAVSTNSPSNPKPQSGAQPPIETTLPWSFLPGPMLEQQDDESTSAVKTATSAATSIQAVDRWGPEFTRKSIPDKKVKKLMRQFLGRAAHKRHMHVTRVKGSFHQCWMVVYDGEFDVEKLIVRSSIRATKLRWTKNDDWYWNNQSRMLEYFDESNVDWTPQLLESSTSFDNPIGRPYMIQSFLHGMSLCKAWNMKPRRIPNGLTQEKWHDKLLKNLAAFSIKFGNTIKASAAGGLIFLDPAEGQETPRLRIGPFFHEGDHTENREPRFTPGARDFDMILADKVARMMIKIDQEPANDNSICYGGALWLLIQVLSKVFPTFNMSLASHAFEDMQKPDYDHIKDSEDVENHIITMAHHAPVSGRACYKLKHPDFNWQNIIVDEDGNIVAVIDLDLLTVMPPSFGYAVPPYFLWPEWHPWYQNQVDSPSIARGSLEAIKEDRRAYIEHMFDESGDDKSDLAHARISHILGAIWEPLSRENPEWLVWVAKKVLIESSKSVGLNINTKTTLVDLSDEESPFLAQEQSQTWTRVSHWMDMEGQ
ncbi:hypothetical protein BT63DRAFT_471904 [Microthyrium microscopicum]|uniref:Aminoglycoside phosphotransferase domain-containing protein n=1 Tax=Microthyrium microscopicum TaxID=703497 RepID=A0A6A6U9B6_9PEZI|nr:hypothetical protein BT63DRAFT_471904 [Microthyrium microscopicum]